MQVIEINAKRSWVVIDKLRIEILVVKCFDRTPWMLCNESW
jgi:hypothetical protein